MRTLPLIGLGIMVIWFIWAYQKAKKKAKKAKKIDIEYITETITNTYYRRGGTRNAAKRLLKLLQTKIL